MPFVNQLVNGFLFGVGFVLAAFLLKKLGVVVF